jgi:hypothetical protein
MKKIIQMFYLFLTVFTVTITGCQKESINPITELAIDGEQKVISVGNNGIGIEFCLLNEQGEPATVFDEGENFRFHLALKNNVKTDTAMYIVSDFLRNPGLFSVFSSNGDTIGQPAKWNGLFKISDGSPIYRGKEWVLEFPWHETRGMEQPFDPYNSIRVLQHHFIGLDQAFLQKGKYYTTFTQQFCLGRYVDPRTEFFCTDTLTLKINFEIK